MPNSLLEQYRRGLAAQGVTDDRDDFFVMRDTLGVWAQEDPALLTAFPDFAEEWRTVREADSPSTLGGIKNTGRKAFLQSRQGMQAIGGLDKTDTEDVSQLETRIREIPSSVPWEDWQRSEGKEAVKVFLRDPIEIVSNIVTAGLTGSVPALAGGLAGGLGGAAAGSPLGPAGSALAGTVGAVTGTFTGSLAVEYGGKYLDVLREEGADLADPESIQRVLENPETRARARSLAYRRGIPVAVFDAASAGLAGKFFKGMKGATTGQIVRRGGGEALVQGGLGGTGEVAGALSAGEEIKPGSVFEEIIGEMGPAAVEIGGAAARRSIVGGAGAPEPLPAIPPPVTPPAAGPAAPIAPLAPVAPLPPTNAQVAIAVERLTDEQAVARLAELQALPSRTPDLDLEIELLVARVPGKTAVVPVAAPIVIPSAAVGTPAIVEPALDTVAPIAPTAAVAPRLSLDEDYTQPAEQIPTIPPPLALDERYGGAPEPRFDNAGGAVLAAVESARATQAEFLGENGLTMEQARLLPPEQQAELQQRFTAWVAAKEATVVQPAAAPEAAPEAQKPVAPVAPTPVPPKVAAPAVAAQPDLPKPTEIAPAVPSAAPTPEERAAVAAVVVPQPQPLPYGQLLPAGPVENFRTFRPTKPLAWEAGVVNLMKPVKGSPLPQVELGDKGGAKGVTKTGLALLMPDGVGVVLAGIVTPQSILRVAGGNDKLGKPALQRMGAGTKGKRSIEVGGELPVLLREVAEAGYKPLGIYRFAGEPAVIFQQFENLEAFDAAVAATARFENAAPGMVPIANVADADLPVGRITGLKRIEAEIDRLSPLLIEAIERKDAAAEATLLARYTELEKRQKAAIAVNQTAARNQPLNPDSPEVQQAIRDLNNDPGVDSARVFEARGERLPDSQAPVDSPRNFTYETINESSLGPEAAAAQREAMERISAYLQASDGLQQNPKVVGRRISRLPSETSGSVRVQGGTGRSSAHAAPAALMFRDSLPNEISQSDRQALADIGASIKSTDGRAVVLTAVEPDSGANSPRGERQMGAVRISNVGEGARERGLGVLRMGIEGSLGKRVIFFRSSLPVSSHGLYSSDHPNTILVNAEAPSPAIALIGHEFAHDLQRQNPKIYATLSELVLRVAPMPESYAQMKLPQGYTQAELEIEYVNDVVGDRFGEQAFWEVVRREAAVQGATDQFKQLITWAKQWLDKLTRGVMSKLSVETRDIAREQIDQIRQAVAKALIDFTPPRTVQLRAQQTETPAFKAWFGKSRAVDAQGKPRVLYHGTIKDFTEFDPARVDNHALYGPGFYLTASRDVSGGDGSYAFKGAYGDDSVIDEIRASSVEDARKQFFADPSNSEYLGDDAEEVAFIPDSDGIVTVINAAEMEGTPNVMPVYAAVENPFLMEDVPANWQAVFNRLIDAAASIGVGRASFDNSLEHLDRDDFNPSMRDLFRGLRFAQDEGGRNLGKLKAVAILKAAGFDGIMYTGGLSSKYGSGRPHDVVVAFRAEQIKSAIGNSGAFDPANRDIRFQSARSPQPPRTDPSRIAVEATHTQWFGQVMSRLRAQGAKVEVLTTEFFRLGVRREIESQIAQLQQRLAGAVGPQRRAIERDIAHRQARLAEVDDARGATFGPWQIALAVDDIQNASMGNLITLIHEAVESLSLTMDSVTKGKIGLAIQASITELRAARDAASERTGVEVASEQGGPFDLLAETLAQKLAAEGIVDPSIAQAVWRWIKDLYYRAAMAIQAAFGADPSHEMALDWFENQLERVIGGDYDYRIGNLIARFLPEQTSERISRFEQPAGTPGAMTDFFDPFEQRLQQPGVLPNTSEAIGWNVQFQTGPAQVVGGLAIPNPEARARENAAGIRKFIEELDAIREANGVTLPWEEWWGQFATSGSDPRVMLAELEQRDASLATAAIGGERMTDVMNGEAALAHRTLMENFQTSSLLRAASATEQIDSEADSVIEASREVNRLEKDRRNSDLQEGALQKRLKGLVRQFTKDNSAGYRAAEQQGALAEAVREAENLIDGDPIPEQYQQVFKSVLDGKTPVFDYIKAIAGLELPLADMTQAAVVKAIRDSSDADLALGRLAQNRPLLTAMAVLARKNAGIVAEIELAYWTNVEDYHIIHDELQEIREATDEQLKQMLATMDERVKAVGPRERLKKDYLARRRTLREARDRLSRAGLRADTITQVLPDVALAVERAQQQGSEAPSEWVSVEGAIFTEMVPTAAGWTKKTRELRTRNDGSFEDSDAIQRAIGLNLRWLDEKISKKGGKAWEDVNRQTMEMRAIDASAQNFTAHGRKMDRFLAPMMSEARNLGGLGPQVAKQLAFFQHIRFVNSQQVETNAHEFSRAWKDVQRSTKIWDIGLLQKQIYDPISYFLNTEPGLDEEAAIRQALRMARARLAVPPSAAFNASVERLLRASKAGFETLVRIATENGAFVRDTKLKSELRNAVARGWLTSMRSMDHGLVTRLTRDAEKYGWKLAREWVDDPRGGGRPKKLKKVKAVTFRDFEAEDMADSDAMVGVLNRLFPSGFLRDWLMPFINKGGVEVFRRGKTEIPQSVIQDAWAQAGQGTTNNGERILRWLDLVDAATASEEFAGETQAVGDEDGDVLDEGDGMPGEKDVGRFRLNMLRQIDALFGMESKMAFDASQTRDMFDPFGPKPHVVMDARMNDHIPQEHINFALLDVQTSGMLLAEIAFHSAFGRNGSRMVALLAEMRKKAEAAKVDYEGLQQTTDAGRDAEAIALGWRDPKELKRLAAVADDIQQFQKKLEGFMGVGHAGGPFDTTSRVWMSLLNFLSGQIVDNPKRAFYDLLNLAQTPFAQRSLGPEAIRTVSDAFVTTAKTGVGSLLEAMHLQLMHASAEELELGQTTGQVRNLPWSVAMADLGPGGRQGWKENVFVKPMQAIRFAQNKGVGLPFQGQAKDFPRLAVIPGLGVSNFVSQISGRSGAMAITRQLERLLSRGAKYFATHRTDATDPAFRFKAKDLGYGRWDQGILDWWRVKAVEYNMGTIEDMVRGAMPPMARGERIITKDQLLKTAGAVATEVNGDSSVNTMPGILVSHPFLRSFFPLLRWPFWAMHKTNEGLATQAGKRNFKSYARGVGILAMWNLPIGLAFTFLLDEYDEEVTGKKSNLPPLGGLAAIPFLGPAAELLAADRSVPDTLVAYAVRGARGGNLGGIAADFIGQIANPSDPHSGRRVISLDQRVLVMSQLLNLQQATSNVIHQDWTTTWASFWSPLFRSVGGNAALHTLDIVNNVVGLDNAESRLVMRNNAGTWLRAAAGELNIELRPGGSGTPTPMSVWTREMSTAAMANDRVGFQEAYRKALEAARKNVASDPSVPIMDREREAERRVLSGWRGRNPLGILARPPTEIEVRRMLGIMDENGAQDVREALNRYQVFTRSIAPSPEQSQARAAERRLMRPPTLPNPFRRQLAPTY